MLDVIAELATLTNYRYGVDIDDASVIYRITADGVVEEFCRQHDGRPFWLDSVVDTSDIVMLSADRQLALHKAIGPSACCC